MPMENYVEFGSIRGYVIDVAALVFERSDGKSFLMKNATGGSVSTTMENITISNGWISAPQAIIDTTATDTVSYTSNLTDLWLIAGVNNVKLQKVTNATVRDGDNYQFMKDGADNASIKIEGEVTNISIEGFELMTGSAPTTGKYTVETIELMDGTTPVGKHTKLTFLAADVNLGDIVPVVYDRKKSVAFSVQIPSSPKAAMGRLTRITPMYSENDESSEVTARIYDTFEKVKVTGVPGFDQSYKSESSHTIEFQSVASRAANAVRRTIQVA